MFSTDTLTDHYFWKYLRCTFVPHSGYLSPKSHPSCDGLVFWVSSGILYNVILDSYITTWALRWFWSGPDLALHDFVFHFSLSDHRKFSPPLCPCLNLSVLALGSSTLSPVHWVQVMGSLVVGQTVWFGCWFCAFSTGDAEEEPVQVTGYNEQRKLR